MQRLKKANAKTKKANAENKKTTTEIDFDCR